MVFLVINNLFCALSKIPNQTHNICVFIVFKAESEPKHEEKFGGVFLQKPKTHFFGGKNEIVF